MEWGQQMRQHQENARDAMYHNSNYSFERRKKKTIVINTSNFTGNSSNVWYTKLLEPVIIDKLSDVYLESFITFNCKDSGSSTTCAFLFGINEFNINTNTSSDINTSGNLENPQCFNKMVIPNEHSSTGTPNKSVIHKAKKLNYICSINPIRLSTLSGTIETLDNQSIWHTGGNDKRIVVELVIIARE